MPPPPTAPMDACPLWARQLSEKYYSRTIAMFVLHGNVHDLVPWKRNGKTEYLPLPRFLTRPCSGGATWCYRTTAEAGLPSLTATCSPTSSAP